MQPSTTHSHLQLKFYYITSSLYQSSHTMQLSILLSLAITTGAYAWPGRVHWSWIRQEVETPTVTVWAIEAREPKWTLHARDAEIPMTTVWAIQARDSVKAIHPRQTEAPVTTVLAIQVREPNSVKREAWEATKWPRNETPLVRRITAKQTARAKVGTLFPDHKHRVYGVERLLTLQRFDLDRR